MPRTIWTKLQSDPNGTWSRFEGEPPFSIPATGGLAYDVATDTGETFVVTPLESTVAPIVTGQPVLAGFAQVGQTLVATAAPVTGTAPITTTWQWLRNGSNIGGATAASYALVAADEGATISVRQTATNSVGSASATSAGQVVAPASSGGVATISSLFVSDQSATGEVVLTYSIDQTSGVAGVLSTDPATPSAAQVAAGQDASGGAAPSAFTDTWAVGGSETLPDIVSGLAEGIYYLHVLPSGGTNTEVVTSNGFQLETQPPVVTGATTSSSGFDVVLTFNEPLAGSTDAADWTVSADGTQIAVATASVVGSEVSLSLSSQISSGQSVLVDYAGTTLIDGVSNPVAAFGGQVVINQVSGSFTESAVAVAQGVYLTANEILPADARGILFFASLAQAPALSSRSAILTWDGVNGGIHADYTTGDGLTGTRIRIQDGTANINETIETVPQGTRYHLLVSAWLDGADALNALAWIYDTQAASWSEGINVSAPSVPGTSILLGPDPARLFARSNATSHFFEGTIHRVALWSGAGQIADIGQPSVRDQFVNGSNIVDPAVSRAAFGQPLIDFAGDAASYNGGVHTGSLGAFTPTGTFS